MKADLISWKGSQDTINQDYVQPISVCRFKRILQITGDPGFKLFALFEDLGLDLGGLLSVDKVSLIISSKSKH